MLQTLTKIAAVNRFIRSTEHEIRRVAILHIDIVNSSRQVQQNMVRAHCQIQALYKRLCSICGKNNGIARELRGDAALFEFADGDDAVIAACAIHKTIALSNCTRMGYLNPRVRTGISYGPVVHSNNMVTGESVIRAQRIEQLALPGEVLFDQYLAEKMEGQIQIKEHSRQQLKGFENESIIYQAIVDNALNANLHIH